MLTIQIFAPVQKKKGPTSWHAPLDVLSILVAKSVNIGAVDT